MTLQKNFYAIEFQKTCFLSKNYQINAFDTVLGSKAQKLATKILSKIYFWQILILKFLTMIRNHERNQNYTFDNYLSLEPKH